MKSEYFKLFNWPEKNIEPPPSVGTILLEEMSSLGWNAEKWSKLAGTIAPTLVGGSKKHGGADLGPTRAKVAWAQLGICGKGLANHPPVKECEEMPRLTLQMAAIIQGFPKEWKFAGKKTPAYRQVGNAFPPPVAEAIGKSIFKALEFYDSKTPKKGIESKAA
jgi:DNA (cytosine-5)-methyltransferase 1